MVSELNKNHWNADFVKCWRWLRICVVNVWTALTDVRHIICIRLEIMTWSCDLVFKSCWLTISRRVGNYLSNPVKRNIFPIRVNFNYYDDSKHELKWQAKNHCFQYVNSTHPIMSMWNTWCTCLIVTWQALCRVTFMGLCSGFHTGQSTIPEVSYEWKLNVSPKRSTYRWECVYVRS